MCEYFYCCHQVSDFVQIDPTYFTRSTINQPPPVTLPTKETKAVSSIPVPSDLVIPRDYKSILGRATEPQPLQAITDQVPLINGVGVKRPAEDDDDVLPPRPANGTTKPRIPPLKRPKQPPNIFIPKPNKVKSKVLALAFMTSNSPTAILRMFFLFIQIFP